MAKSRNQKGKLLYLAEIFHRETDEAHRRIEFFSVCVFT